jgi:uncharacterized protein (DUF1330 family)
VLAQFGGFMLRRSRRSMSSLTLLVTDQVRQTANAGRTNEAASAVFFKDTSGRYLVRTNKITALDGTPPKRSINAVFDSMEKALPVKP